METLTIEELMAEFGKRMLSPQDPWSSFVPIIEREGGFDVFIHDGISTPDEYSKLAYLLQEATEGQTVRFFLNTPGGSAESGYMLYENIKNCKAKTVAIPQGCVASAGTFLTLACDEIEVTPFLEFMIHEISAYGIGGKLSDIHTYQTFAKEHTKATFALIYGGFLSEAEIRKVLNGKEIWLSGEEVLTRFTAMKEHQNG